jgi:4-hydroxy-tetrahydrodipicolinate reductase
VRLCLFGAGGKVGSVLGPALERAGHEVVDGREAGPAECVVAIEFTRPDAVLGNAARALDARVPLVVGTTGFDTGELDRLAREAASEPPPPGQEALL